ncbi:MAG: hypothetical protein IPK82_27505 [Polyangiaceae bacterium]|nr:hypothetical protein [Polyangiaceae bacterium]
MASKLVVNRQKSADSVIAVGEAHAASTQEALTTLLKPHIKKGEAAPSFAAVMTLACDLLESAKDRMVKQDAAHEAELADDAPVRVERDKAAIDLYDELVQIREMLTGAYGSVTQQVFAGPTPQDPVMLSRFSGEVIDALGKVKLPAPRIKGAKLDLGEIASNLNEKRAKLDQHLKAVQREVREAQATLEGKNEAMAAYDEVFAGVASVLSGLLRLAGRRELAAKVRPSTRRPGVTEDSTGESADNAANPAPAPSDT